MNVPISLPVFDGHNDLLLAIDGTGRSFFRRSNEGHIDLVRAREGGLGGGFCAVFVRPPGVREPRERLEEAPPPIDAAYAQMATIEGMARLFRLEEESRGQVRIVHTASELETSLRSGVFAALLHIEGAESIDPELNTLEVFHRAGLRSLGPVWSRPNVFGHGVPFGFGRSPDTGPGLTDLGQELVRACNQLRIMIDLSHLNEQGFWDVARLSDAPLVATHSNAWAITPSTRNLTDRQLDAIKDSEGMVGVNFAVIFLREDGRPVRETPLEAVVKHVDYLVERLGIDRVGFGSDFDGAMIPGEIGDAAGLPRLLDVLRRHGYDEAALRKLTHENWIRVLRQTWGS